MTFFYNLNKTLDAIRAKPETTHGQLNERDMGKHNNAVTGFKAVADKAAKEYGSKEAGERVAGAQFQKMKKAGKLEEELEEGFVDTVKSGAQAALGAIGSTMGHGSDEDMIKDLQKKAGLPQTGKVPPQQPGQQPTTAGQPPVAEEGGMPMTPKQKSFAKLAPPADKITFADKIAGAKKEVDEMLGDVAAEAMKNALRGKQQVADEGNEFSGELAKAKAQHKDHFSVDGKEYPVKEEFPTVASARANMHKRKVGDVTHGAKHDTEETPTGRRVTRRVDDKGYSVGSETDDEGNAKSTEKRGRGRPKSADKGPERVTAKATKHKGGRKTNEAEGEGDDMVKLAKVIASCKTQAQLDTARRMAQNFLKKHQTGDLAFYGSDMKRGQAVAKDIASKRDEIGGIGEEAVSKKQQKFMGMVHATQKGEKAPSKEVAKVAKTMKKGDAEDFASTKHKGLPEKKVKKEKTEETTTAGSVAPAAGGKSKGGSIVGKGIYDSLNRDLEAMISESMNVSVNVSTDDQGQPHKNITVSAEGEAAEQLAQLLNLAGMQAQDMGGDEGCGCETSPCSCKELDENQPDWPTDQETIGNDDPLMRRYAGGVNGPKSTGQADGAPPNLQTQRQGVMGENKDLGMKLYAELKSFKG